MDRSIEADLFEKRELRSNRSHPKPPVKEEVYIQKLILGEGRDLDGVLERLPNDGCGEWRRSVNGVDLSLSLKKKGRRALLDELRANIEAWNENLDDGVEDDDENQPKVSVSALEKKICWTRRHHDSPKGMAYHGVEMDEATGETNPVHRYPTHALGNVSTLTQKQRGAKPKQKSKARRGANDRRPVIARGDEEQSVVQERPEVQLRYVITTVQDQEKFKLNDVAQQKYWSNRVRNDHGNRRRNQAGKMLMDQWLDEKDGYEYEYEDDEEEGVEEEVTDQASIGQTESDMDSIDFLTDADQTTNEGQITEPVAADQIDSAADEIDDHVQSQPSDNMSVNLVDLAFLRCIQVEARAQKKLDRQRRPRPRFHTETSVDLYTMDPEDDLPGPSGVSKSLSDSEEVESINAPIPNVGLRADDYFQMVPFEITCVSSSVNEVALRETYGDAYYECPCVPRRFVVDITAKVKQALRSISCPDAVDVHCVFEVIPPTVLDTLLDEEDRDTMVTMNVWINGTFARHVRHITIDTINPCGTYTVDQIVEQAAKMCETWPLDHFIDANEVSYASSNSAAQLIVGSSMKCLERSKATAQVLEQENMLKKIQRQITAVKHYDWANEFDHKMCGICLDWPVEYIGFCLPECRHWFCNSCWRHYCSERILNGFGSLTCPYPKCTSAIDYYTLTTVVPLPICKTYGEQLRDQCISKSSNQYSWCPNAKCGRLIQVAGDTPTPSLACICGYFWCTECSSASHWPATCDHAKMYLKKLKDRHDDPTLLDPGVTFEKRIHAVEVKPCPHCRILMEKGEGCICMSCRCGKTFCWACGAKWEDRNHSGCYAARTIKGFTNVRLIDVGKEFAGEIREVLYDRSLAHRMAVRTAHTAKLRQAMFTKCWNTPRRVQKLAQSTQPSDASSSGGEMQVNEQRIRMHVAAVGDHIKRFMDLRRQAHYLLEFIYVHLQYSSPAKWKRLEALKFAVDRLEFALDRMEEACKLGNLQKVDEFMERVKMLLRSLIKEIWSVKLGKVENAREDSN